MPAPFALGAGCDQPPLKTHARAAARVDRGGGVKLSRSSWSGGVPQVSKCGSSRQCSLPFVVRLLCCCCCRCSNESTGSQRCATLTCTRRSRTTSTNRQILGVCARKVLKGARTHGGGRRGIPPSFTVDGTVCSPPPPPGAGVFLFSPPQVLQRDQDHGDVYGRRARVTVRLFA